MRLFCVAVFAAFPLACFAEDFTPVSQKSDFMALVDGRTLRIGLYDLSLEVKPDGTIAGDALGWTIDGKWSWDDGYFCREMDWSGRKIDFNCQLVEVRGDQDMRFTVDKGAGRSATFRLQ